MGKCNPKILIVDDDPASIALLKGILKRSCYEDVDAFLDSKKAQFSYREKNYDILITDLRMPGVSGFDILQEMQKAHHHRPSIIVLTAESDPKAEEEAIRMGATKVFIKPYDVKELLQELDKQVAQLNF